MGGDELDRRFKNLYLRRNEDEYPSYQRHMHFPMHVTSQNEALNPPLLRTIETRSNTWTPILATDYQVPSNNLPSYQQPQTHYNPKNLNRIYLDPQLEHATNPYQNTVNNQDFGLNDGMRCESRRFSNFGVSANGFHANGESSNGYFYDARHAAVGRELPSVIHGTTSHALHSSHDDSLCGPLPGSFQGALQDSSHGTINSTSGIAYQDTNIASIGAGEGNLHGATLVKSTNGSPYGFSHGDFVEGLQIRASPYDNFRDNVHGLGGSSYRAEEFPPIGAHGCQLLPGHENPSLNMNGDYHSEGFEEESSIDLNTRDVDAAIIDSLASFTNSADLHNASENFGNNYRIIHMNI